ncbi:MAG: hypothetical protein ABFS17_13650 [Chloroflexota bacterium]
MNNKIASIVIAGVLLLLAILLMIPQTNQILFSLLGIDTRGESAVRSDFDAFIPFIPGYFPEGFYSISVGLAFDEAPDKNTYSEFYASDTHFYKIIQSQGEGVEPFLPSPDLLVQDKPAQLTNQFDLDAYLGDDLDLNQFDTSEVWMLSVVMRELTVQVISNHSSEEVIRFANELIPQRCTSTPTPEN